MTSASESNYPVKVSVILPTYNQKHYLLSAIQSLLTQTFQDFELIIVNDGSTDETQAFLASVQHPKIQVINQSNQGLPGALNTGFAAAKGEYWTWTSTDNTVAPAWLEELVNALDNSSPEVGYALSNYAAMDENEKIIFFNRNLHFNIPSLLMRNSGNASFLYRASLAKKVGPYDTSLKYAEDLDMWVRMADISRAVHVNTVLYYYRLHANSMTAQQDKVREATRGVVNKYLAKTGGVFDINHLFPSISLSANPALEKWKSRIWLASIGYKANFYCPVDALVDQLIKALKEKYEPGLVANIVHLLVKENRWESAATAVAAYQQADPSDFLNKLAEIVARKDKAALQQIPFLTIDEKLLAIDCKGPWSQYELLNNFCSIKKSETKKAWSFEELTQALANQLEDMQDHPEIWQRITRMKSDEEMKFISDLRIYLGDLLKIPQEKNAYIVLNVLDTMFFAYIENPALAQARLQQLNLEYPNIALLTGAITYLGREISHQSSVAISET